MYVQTDGFLGPRGFHCLNLGATPCRPRQCQMTTALPTIYTTHFYGRRTGLDSLLSKILDIFDWKLALVVARVVTSYRERALRREWERRDIHCEGRLGGGVSDLVGLK